MGSKAVRVNFFFAGGCIHCAKARDALRKAAESAAHVEWEGIDIGKNPHRAVDVGVVSTPAVAIDGRLVFKSTPTPAELQTAIKARTGKGPASRTAVDRAWPGVARMDQTTHAANCPARSTCDECVGRGSARRCVCPFCTPALVVLLGVAAGSGSVMFGVLLLLAFAVGRSVPIILGGWAIGALEGMKPLGRYQRAFEVAGGIVLILMGLYMLNAFFILIPELAV